MPKKNNKIPGGYILQPRKFCRSSVSGMPPVTREIWLYLLRMVNYYDNHRTGIKRGSGFFTYKDIADDLAWYAGFRKITYKKDEIAKSLRRLRDGNAIETMKATRGLIVTICNFEFYQDPKNYESNRESNTKATRKQHGANTIHKESTEEVKEIIIYLNAQSGKRYKHTSKKTKDLINARFNDNFTVEDFKTVIRNKTNHWKGTDFDRFLRPETLFGTKFEGYLNEDINKPEEPRWG